MQSWTSFCPSSLWNLLQFSWFAYCIITRTTCCVLIQDCVCHKIEIFHSFYTYWIFLSLQRGKQHWQGDSFNNNFDSFNFNARNNFKHRNERRFSNPNRNEDYRSFEDREFDLRKTSSNPRKRKRDFVSDRGFRFNNEPRRKNSNPQYLKRYTFWIPI